MDRKLHEYGNPVGLPQLDGIPEPFFSFIV